MENQHREPEGCAMPVLRKGLHQRADKGGAPRWCDRVDFAVGPLFLCLFPYLDESVFGEFAQCRINRAEAGLHEVLKAAVLENFLDLVSGRVATRQDAETDGANVHARQPYIGPI